MDNIKPLEIWKKSHWMFSLYIQGLIICFSRLETHIKAGDINGAGIELETAAQLMLSSAAAMQMAGSFGKQTYNESIRKMMMPPHVKSENFSGLMHWDHAYLMTILKKLRPMYSNLPDSLQPQYDRFISAYKVICTSHKAICEQFGGAESGSLRSSSYTAIDMLDKFEQQRLRLIDPRKCSSESL